MALKDAALRAARVPLLLALAACAPAREAVSSRPNEVVFEDDERDPSVPTVLVFTASSAHTYSVWQSLREEISPDFSIVTKAVDRALQPKEMARQISVLKPACVVLLGNVALNRYRRYQEQSPGPHPPALIAMASFLQEQSRLLSNITGIAYEVPGVTSFVNLRLLVDTRVHRAGVLYRGSFEHYVEDQRRLAKSEELELVAVEVRDRPSPEEIRRGLRTLLNYESVDAIWVLNDNILLTPELIAASWLPVLHAHPTPVVVGVRSLVDARLHFGSFGLLPDHAALGVQAANLVYRLEEEGWRTTGLPIEQPLSVRRVIDLPWSRKHLSIRDGALDFVDQVVE